MPYTEQGIGYRESETSIEAAAKVTPSVKTIRAQVLRFIIESPAAVDFVTIADALDMPDDNVKPRLTELMQAGLIKRVDRNGTTRHGNACYRFKAIDKKEPIQ